MVGPTDAIFDTGMYLDSISDKLAGQGQGHEFVRKDVFQYCNTLKDSKLNYDLQYDVR